MVAESDTPAESSRIFRLSQITARLKDILLEATTRKFWLRAQLVPDRIKAAGGHFYGQLVEKDARGNDVARLRVTIWRSNLDRIERTLAARAPEHAAVLKTGGEVCAYCSIQYHEVYGLSLLAHEVDPDLGESQLSRNRRMILESLQRDGLLEKNRERTIPAATLRIGLVTATDSAAYADFIRTLTHSGFSFQIIHVPAVMQGAMAPSSVSTAINRLARESLDVLCVIRGGGSPLDLAWLDHEHIARALANSPHPVWVGIGHEIDFGVLDQIAHTSHKTPTAVAEALVARLRELQARIDIAADRLVQAADRSLQLADRRWADRDNGLHQGCRKHLSIQLERFKQRANRLHSEVAQISERYARKQQFALARLGERTRSVEETAQRELAVAIEKLQTRTDRMIVEAAASHDRARDGLKQGSRKHAELFAERMLRLRLRLQAVVDRSADRIARTLAVKQTRLDAAAQGLMTSAGSAIRWRRGGVAKARQVLERADRALLARGQRIRLATYENRVDAAAGRLEQRQKRLEALAPERLMAKGYSVTRTADGKLIRSVADALPGERIVTQLQDGTVTSVVEEQQHGR